MTARKSPVARSRRRRPMMTVSLRLIFLPGASDADASDTLTVTGIQTSGNQAGIQFLSAENKLSVNPLAYNYLNDGQKLDVIYTYDVEDGNGGKVAQTAKVTITGTDNVPVVARRGHRYCR